MTDENEIGWEINTFETPSVSIGRAWKFCPRKGKAFRQHLGMNISALHDLLKRNGFALQECKLDRI